MEAGALDPPDPALSKGTTVTPDPEHAEGEDPAAEGAEGDPATARAQGSRIAITVTFTHDGRAATLPATAFMLDRKAKKAAAPTYWVFTGSYMASREVEGTTIRFLAAGETHVAASIFHDPSALLNLPYFSRNPYQGEDFGYEANVAGLPEHFRDPENPTWMISRPVRLILAPAPTALAPPDLAPPALAPPEAPAPEKK